MNNRRDEASDLAHLGFLHSTRGDCGRADAQTGSDERLVLVKRNGVLVNGDERSLQSFLSILACDSFSVHPHINEHQVVVSTAGNQTQPLLLQLAGERLGVGKDLTLILFEIVSQCFAKSDGLGRNDVNQWTALDSREQLSINLLRMLFLAKNQTTARATQSFMRSSGHVVSVRDGRRMQTSSNWPGYVGYIGEHASAN